MRCDVLIVGAGHAGCEAGLAAARLGCQTIVLTASLLNVARMPCNPSIGGPAKAHLVREVDALGGEMGRVIDRTHLHIRMLNTGKGPAVQALRAQADRPVYSEAMRTVVLEQPGLSLVQDLAESLLVEGGRVVGVLGTSGTEYRAGAVVLTTGTFLGGQLHMGEVSFPGGRSGEPPAQGLSDSLKRHGLQLGRLKTGTPPRVHRDSVDFASLEEQPPAGEPLVFSDLSPLALPPRQLSCYITRTTEKTREIILANLSRSPMYAGLIEGVGPRYCPSLEDKIVRFADKPTHQVFVEPEGFDVPEVYLQGVSTSLPLDVQLEMVRSMPGLERAEILRPGYAVEYDYVVPTQLDRTLAVPSLPGLFLGGQINGTSGYEEAAAQGLLAGLNAARYAGGQAGVEIGRDQGYLGVLVDDLVTRGTSEPYRMHTSRAEYRLLLRQDNSDERLTPLGHSLGLVCSSRWRVFEEKRSAVCAEELRLRSRRLGGPESSHLSDLLGMPIRPGTTLEEVLRRPHVGLGSLRSWEGLEPLALRVTEQVEIRVKYAGYIQRQQDEVARFRRMEDRVLPELAYDEIPSLSSEAREKLGRARPRTLGQASRLPGISPADIAVLLVALRHRQPDGEWAAAWT